MVLIVRTQRACGHAEREHICEWSAMKRRFHRMFVRQSDASDCGAACLAAVLRFYCRYTTLREVVAICPAGRDGIRAARIVSAARTFGLKGRVLRVGPDQLTKIAIPAILHWEKHHWVVLCQFTKTGADLIDPSRGLISISSADLAKAYSGFSIEFELTPEFKRRSPEIRTPFLRWLWDDLRATVSRQWLIFLVIACLVIQGGALLLPAVTKFLIDDALPKKRLDLVNLVILGALVGVAAQETASALRWFILVRIRATLDSRLLSRLVLHILRAPLDLLTSHASGDILSRLEAYSNVRQLFTEWSLSALFDSALVLIYIVACLMLNVRMGAVAVVFLGLYSALLVVTGPRQHRYAYAATVANAEQSAFLIEAIAGAHQYKAAATEETIATRWHEKYVSQLNAESTQSVLMGMLYSCGGLCAFCGPIVVLWCGAHLVGAGILSEGDMLMASGVTVAMFAPFMRCANTLQQAQNVTAAILRLDMLVDAPEEPVGAPLKGAQRITGGVTLRHVSFAYPGERSDAVCDLSFDVPAASKLAIVGFTGSGKSTIVDLILGLRSPRCGAIEFDGLPSDTYRLQDLRRQIGVVLQHISLFRGTIRDNITLGRHHVTERMLVEAATRACIHDEIAALPLGYDTRLSEDGGNVSGGQRQRLALARALIDNPAILLLDEATSHLDSETERQIEEIIGALSCTRIVVAHRLSTVVTADNIVVLDRGRLVEHGTHVELLSRKGVYCNLMQATSNRDKGSHLTRDLLTCG